MRSLAMVVLSIVAFGVTGCTSAGGSNAPSPSVPATTTAPSVEPSATPSPEPVELTIFAAASLKGALEKAEAAYEAANSGVTITLSLDSSAALATQIEQGAPADVLLSADMKNPQKLVDGGLAEGGAVVFATNLLTVIVPTGDPAGIATPAGLAKAGVKVIAAGDEVPITKYASELVANLAREAGYPADFAAGYAANVASREDSVKAVVARIELGEGDAGIVYVTDAAASTKVQTIEVPGNANVLATYAGVVVKASSRVQPAQAFLDWFAGPGGQAILSSFGFLPPTR